MGITKKQTRHRWLALAALSIALASCGCTPASSTGEASVQPSAPEISNVDKDIYAIYDLYLEETKNLGNTPLSYEEWLNSIKGDPGETPYIGKNGNWWIGDKDTHVSATGPQGEKGDRGIMGSKGDPGDKGDKGDPGAPGQDGQTPHIGENGNWWIGDQDTGIAATGAQGEKGDKGDKGDTGDKGDKGDPGAAGQDGQTPHIGQNGNWWIGQTDTGVAATGAAGANGQDGKNGADGKDGKDADLYGVTFTVTFDVKGGVLPDGCADVVEVAALHTIELPIPTREHFVFTGWFTGDTVNDGQFTNATPVSKNLTLYARWKTEQKFSVTLRDGDSVLAVTEYYAGAELDEPAIPTKTDYTSTGWYLDPELTNRATFPMTITENITLYAGYADAYYSIYFKEGDSSILNPVTYKAGTSVVSLPEATKTYSNFLGWYLDADLTEPISLPYEIHHDTVLYASFQAQKVTLTYDYNYSEGGGPKYTETYDAGTYLSSLRSPTRTGYIFDGWYRNGVKKTSLTIVENTTLVARWTYDASDILMFEGGTVYAKSTSISGEIVIPSTWNGVTITAIKSAGFVGCNQITKIVVPSTVSSIPSGCFAGCTALTEMELPFIGTSATASGSNGNFGKLFGTSSYSGTTVCTQHYDSYSSTTNKFYIPSGLQTVRITDATRVPDWAFENISMIRKVTLNDGVTSCGVSAFNGCTSLTEFEGLQDVSGIGDYAFCDCTRLSGFTLGSRVTTIGEGAFIRCKSLTSLNLPSTISVIKANAFFGCTALSRLGSNVEGSFVIPKSVTSIGRWAFGACTRMTYYEAPFIGVNAAATGQNGNIGTLFSDSSSDGTTLCTQHYDSYSSTTNKFYIPSGLQTVRITDATRVPDWAFENTHDVIRTIYINSMAQYSVGTNAFNNAASPTYF